MGSYFGALVAALVTAMADGPAEQMQRSMWSGFGFGFVFWTLSISFLNRVLIQGLSRSSIGKKVFKLELISSTGHLTWSAVITRWVASFASFIVGGAGYLWMFFDREHRTIHDLVAHTDVVPIYEGASMSVEQRTDAPLTAAQIHQMLILSNSQAERPMATVIQLPVRERLAQTGTEGSTSVLVNETVAIAPVIQINPSRETAENAEEAGVEKEKKAA